MMNGCTNSEEQTTEIKQQKPELEILEENLPYLESEESKLIREHNQKMLGFDPSKEDKYRKQLQERKKKIWIVIGWKESEYKNEQERKYVEEFLDPDNRKFQLYLMYNIYDVKHALNEMFRLLKKGGIGVISVPNYSFWRYRIDSLLGKIPHTNRRNTSCAVCRHISQARRHP